jgi:hypothetical protein
MKVNAVMSSIADAIIQKFKVLFTVAMVSHNGRSINSLPIKSPVLL